MKFIRVLVLFLEKLVIKMLHILNIWKMRTLQSNDKMFYFLGNFSRNLFFLSCHVTSKLYLRSSRAYKGEVYNLEMSLSILIRMSWNFFWGIFEEFGRADVNSWRSTIFWPKKKGRVKKKSTKKLYFFVKMTTVLPTSKLSNFISCFREADKQVPNILLKSFQTLFKWTLYIWMLL